jgi:hypothetical protein
MFLKAHLTCEPSISDPHEQSDTLQLIADHLNLIQFCADAMVCWHNLWLQLQHMEFFLPYFAFKPLIRAYMLREYNGGYASSSLYRTIYGNPLCLGSHRDLYQDSKEYDELRQLKKEISRMQQ